MNFDLGIPAEIAPLISLIAAILGVVSFVFAFFCFKKQREHRKLLDFTEKQVDDLQNLLARSKEALETNGERVAEQARRIAWLENRVRQPKAAEVDAPTEAAVAEVHKLNMTERRHRVIGLASRGKKRDEIATVLGMLPGEVELIIDLTELAHKK